MSNEPLISIIIPTYNRDKLLGETLVSIQNQTYPNWECLVIDDAHDKKTEALVTAFNAKDSRIRYYKRPNDIKTGGNGARNFGFSISKGSFVQWFDDDDVMLANFLEAKLKAFDSYTDLVICSSTKVDEHLNTIENLNLTIKENLYKEYILWQFKIVTNNVLFKKSFLQNRPLFNPDVLRGQEAEFFSRLFFEISEDSYKVINKPLFLYRQHSATKTVANNIYNSKFKNSEIFIANTHLQNAVIKDDAMLIQYFYAQLVRLCFRAIKHKDVVNAKLALLAIKTHIRPLNAWLVLQLKCIVYLLLTLKKGSITLENFYKSYNVL